MGNKIQCNSTHHKNSNHDYLVNKQKQNWYERKLNDEYKRLKSLSERNRKISSYEIVFGQIDFKKQISRMKKWSSIAFQPLPKDFYESHKLEVNVSYYCLYNIIEV